MKTIITNGIRERAKNVLLRFLTFGTALTLPAADWYVDASAPAEGANGSQANPFPAIQTAVNAASSDDTIHVAEGVYDSGETQLISSSYSRVEIDKKLHLIGAGRGKSIIVGSRDPADDDFVTRDRYVRCVCVRTDGKGSIIEGFTLRDGESDPSTTAGHASYGGGLYAYGGLLDAYLVDCGIEHCAGGLGGGADGGTLLRCRLKDNYGNSGPATRESRLINCIVTGSRSSQGSRALFQKGELYNCTAIDNAASAWTMDGKGSAYNCIFALNTRSGVYYRETNTIDEVAVDCTLGSVLKNFMLVAGPAVGDYRPLAGSAAVAAGRISHLTSLSLPEGVDALKDFNGRTIVADGEGRINTGAIQEIMTPAGGALLFGDGTTTTTDRYEVANCPVNTTPFYTWVYPDVYPTQYCVRVTMSDGDHLHHLARLAPTGLEGGLYPPSVPDRNGVIWMMPPPDPSVISTNQAYKAKTVLYVDPNPAVGSDTEGDGSESAPFFTIQKAISSIDGRTLIYLRPGEYANDVQVTSVPERGRYRFHVEFKVVNGVNNSREVRIVSTDGPENTIIRGAPDPDSTETGDFAGMGPNAVKGAYIEGNGVILQGLTLAGCYTDSTNAVDGKAMMGAALHGVSGAQNARPLVYECVITDCHAASYVVANPMNLLRCRFYNSNSPRTYPIYGGVLSSCYSRGLTCTAGGSGAQGLVGGNANIYQSTFTGELGQGRVTGDQNISYNSIWYGGRNIYSLSHYTNCIVYNPSGSNAKGTFRKIDPRFADLSTSGAVRADSPAIGTGDVPGADNFGTDYWKYACGDMEGNPLVFNAAGQPTLGAFQTPVEVVSVSAPASTYGGWAFADGHSYGTFDFSAGETLSITKASGARNCIGVTCAGLEYAFSNAPNGIISIPYADIAGEGMVTLSAIYATDWYVDAVNGSDANSGFSAAEAKRTLAAATVPMAAGDTLWVLPGIYNDGVSASTASSLLVSNRVVVKEGTAVVSTDGPEVTFIVGADATIDPDANGCGTNAVRCAYVSKNSRLSGFTLTGGRVNMTNAAQTDDGSGSAAAGFGRSYGCVVENCIISNNYSRYGTTFKCDIFGCRVTDNTASVGSGVRQGNAYGCWFDRNYGDPVISYPQYVWNCTLTRGNVKVKGESPLAGSASSTVTGTRIFNTFFGSSANVNSDDSAICHSIVHNNGGSIKAGVVTNGLIRTNTNYEYFNDDGTPKIGANSCIDAGDASLNTNVLGNVDLRGFQRIMNGRMDIGCYETDWRTNYAAVLSSSPALSVTAADPRVVLTNGTEMTVRDGTLTAEWSNPSGRLRILGCGVEVTGNGTLTVSLAGAQPITLTAADGPRRLELRSAATSTALTFTYAPGADDPGYAVLSGFTREGGGITINFR